MLLQLLLCVGCQLLVVQLEMGFCHLLLRRRSRLNLEWENDKTDYGKIPQLVLADEYLFLELIRQPKSALMTLAG